MKRSDIAALMAGIAPVINEHVEKRIAAATAPLAKRIVELEQRPQVRYRGVWTASEAYPEGSLVTHHGSVWHADLSYTRSTEPPGTGAGWTLAIKRGRDGRGAR